MENLSEFGENLTETIPSEALTRERVETMRRGPLLRGEEIVRTLW